MFRYYAIIDARRVELFDWNGNVFGGLRVARGEASARGLDGCIVRVEPNV